MATVLGVRGVVRSGHVGRRPSKENVACGVARMQERHAMKENLVQLKVRPAPFGGKDLNTAPTQGSQPMEVSKQPFQTKTSLKRRQGVGNTTSNLLKSRRIEANVQTVAKYDAKKIELSSLKEALNSYSPPVGVVDIDAKSGLFWSPDYAQEIVEYLQSWEKKNQLPKNHLDQTNLTSKVHVVLVDWLIQVQEHLRLEQQTLHLGVAILHRFIHLEPRIPLPKIQLIGITAMLIAAKFFERFAPSIHDLVHLTDNSYSYKEVIRMERTILKMLKFQIHMCLPTDFADRFLRVSRQKPEMEVEMVRYLLDLTLVDRSCASIPPSRLAAGAVSLTHGVFKHRERRKSEGLFDKSLQYYSGWNTADLVPVKQKLIQLLLCAEDPKYHASLDKYKKEKRHKVSLLPELRNLDFLKNAAGLSSRRASRTSPPTECQTKTLEGIYNGNTKVKIVTAL
jgi:hypothetical protein